MYKFLFIVLLLPLLVANNAFGQKKEANNSLLWRISGHGLSKPSFLFGTIHLICPADYIWTSKMKKCFNASEKVCFEMDLDDHETMLSATSGFIDTSSKKLKDYFTPQQYKVFKKFMKDSIGIDVALLQQLKPIAVQSFISMKAVNCNNALSYEDTLMRMSKTSHKEVLGLEHPSEQIEALGSLPADSVIKELNNVQEGFAVAKREYANLVAAYKNQEIATLYNMVGDSPDMSGNIGALLFERNARWIPRMDNFMKQSSIFFAVGAGHLWGEKGVIELLRHQGYTVEPLK